MAEGGENLTGVDQEAGAKPKKGRGRGLSKTNTSLVDPEIRKIEQEELCSSKASEKSTAHQNLGTARVEKESTTNEELLKTLQSIEKSFMAEDEHFGGGIRTTEETIEVGISRNHLKTKSGVTQKSSLFHCRANGREKKVPYNFRTENDSSVESVLPEQSENGQQGVIVCPGLLSMKNAGRNKRVNVKVCNISASVIKILPKTNLCQVSQVRVMDTWNPETPTTDKTKDHKPLTDLGVKVNPLAESCVIGKSMKLKSEEVDETPQKLSNIDWREEQGKDKVISRVKDLLNGGVKPSGNNLQQESEPVRLLLREWRQLVAERGILVRKAVIAGEEVRQLVLPESTEKMPRPEQKESTEKSDISESESSDEGTIIRKRKGKTKRNLSISERKSTADSYDSSRQYSTMGSSHSTGRSSITRNSTTTFESPTPEITEPRRSERVRKPPESISRMWYDYFSVDKMI
uniref:Uncharacterized protein n=1 Tax=Magallana gigas TaxID=29159 RepID=A0A8W8JJX2_MAGGI